MHEPAKLGQERSLIFQNVANDVPIAVVMATFRRSESEIEREVAYVARKISEYRFRRALPPLPSSTLAEIRFNRRALLETLTRLGPNYLGADFLLPDIKVQKLDHPGVLAEAAHRMSAAA